MRRVDHGDRQDRVGEVAADLVASTGLEGLTVRNVARAAGCSTNIVSHYFSSKNELVLHTYNAAARRARQRMELAMSSSDDPLKAGLIALLPLNETGRRDWKVWFAFWPLAIGDPEFAERQRQSVNDACDTISAKLKDPNFGGLDAATDWDLEARRLVALVQGIASQAIFDRSKWPKARQVLVVSREVDRLRSHTNGSASRRLSVGRVTTTEGCA